MASPTLTDRERITMLRVLIIPVLLVFAHVLQELSIVHALEALVLIAVVIVDIKHGDTDGVFVIAVTHLLLHHVRHHVHLIVLVLMKSHDFTHLHFFWLKVLVQIIV